MAFTTKQINVTFTLAPNEDIKGNTVSQPTFKGTDKNQVTLTGYRISAHIAKAGGLQSQGALQLRIFGMSLDLMNQLSTLGKTPIYVEGPQKNFISVSAGDDSGVGLIFQGSISQAFTDFAGTPEVCFNVSAFSLLYTAVLTLPATSFNGQVSAATVLQGLATQSNLNFENNGVNVILTNPYYGGSALTQIIECIKEANIEWNNGDNGILAIWPKGGSRGGTTTVISPETGLVGYPYPSGGAFMGLTTLFNPQINFGGKVEVKSEIGPANGPWTVQNLNHDIESETPNGRWFTELTVVPPGYTALI